jgi:hypothetical protein
MTTQEIHNSLDAMLVNTKSRNFINHLVRAYFPASKVDKVWDKPQGQFKCVLTKEPLISVQEIMSGMHTEEFKTDLMNSLRGMFDESKPKVNAIKNIVGDRLLGFTGTNTTTFMCQEALQAFYDWVVTKTLMGDKHINWLLNSITHSSQPSVDTQKERVEKPKKEQTKATTYSLGEVDAFKKLREKFKD